MSKSGMIAALRHGAELPAFGSLAEAEVALFRERDQRLALLSKVAGESNGFACTFAPESLKELERWYFEILDAGAFSTLLLSQDDFERCLASYFGEVLVRNSPPFEWFVSEFPFEPGRYEIGIRRPLAALMLTGRKAPEPRERNRGMQSLWRDYHKYAG
jgi:hypothetical protein